MSFCHLHVHTGYSLLDGSIKIKDLITQAKALNMPAIAITDHGNMYGAVEFYKEAKKAGIKPIIGYEAYVAPESRFKKAEKPYHLVLLAQNQEGYKNLCRLASAASLEGFYSKPRIDKELLAQHNQGLVVLSSCIAGEIPQLILKNNLEEATKAASWYKELLGNRFFLEAQDQGLPQQPAINQGISQISKALDIEVVATNDVHYLEQEDAHIHDIILCIGTQKTLKDSNRLRFATDQFYLKNYREMRQVFPEGYLQNTLKIADMIDLELTFGQSLIPPFQLPNNYNSPREYLRDLCYQGLKRRYNSTNSELIDRLDYELNVIHNMGFDNYFLIVWDFIRFARQNNIMVGPGRGSAAGSLVAFVLGITDIDPIRYHLIFERFLNPERVSMPDIDTDFDYEDRDKVIKYVTEKYGQTNVAQIITFGTMASRLAVRDVGRVMDIPYSEVDHIAKLIPGDNIRQAIKESSELTKLYTTKTETRELLDAAVKIAGLPRHSSTHAAGVVISPQPLLEYTPVQKTEGVITTQYSMDHLEQLGLLKMDFLGLRTLTIIKETTKLAGLDIQLDDIPLDDEKTFDLLQKGNTSGVFQLESKGMRKVLCELQPTTIEDVIAVVALYRPGPMNQIPVFVKNKHNPESIEYLHPDLEPILKTTYGVIVYQEQIIRIAADMAGFTLGQADVLRRAIGKKKEDELQAQKTNFVAGVAKKYSHELGEELFNLIERFASYGFNKSHATAYAVIAYQTAYLKAHYPLEFMAATMSKASDAAATDKVTSTIRDCQEQNITVLPPDINKSLKDFTVEKKSNAIRLGLSGIKGVGSSAINAILKARESGLFKSLREFCSRVDSSCNKKTIETLILCGAFDSLGGNRAQYLNELDRALALGQEIYKRNNSAQMSLLGMLSEFKDTAKDDLLPIKEFPLAVKLNAEQELLGAYITGHPLDEYKSVLQNLPGVTPIKNLTSERDYVIIGGAITNCKQITTKKGDPMCFLQIADYSKKIEVVVFPKVYDRYRQHLKENQALLLAGRVEKQDLDTKLICQDIALFPQKKITINLDSQETKHLKLIKNVLEATPGNIPVYFYYDKSQYNMLLGIRYWVSESPILKKINEALGPKTLNIVSL